MVNMEMTYFETSTIVKKHKKIVSLSRGELISLLTIWFPH